LFKCKNNFYGTVEKNILLFRLNLINYIWSLPSECLSEVSCEQESQLIRTLRMKVRGINCDIDYLLQEGLLTLYIDFTDIRELCMNQLKPDSLLQSIIKKMVEEYSSLLRQYFVFQAYQHKSKSKQKTKRN
jgi:hypothetical protein